MALNCNSRCVESTKMAPKCNSRRAESTKLAPNCNSEHPESAELTPNEAVTKVHQKRTQKFYSYWIKFLGIFETCVTVPFSLFLQQILQPLNRMGIVGLFEDALLVEGSKGVGDAHPREASDICQVLVG